MEYLQNLTVIPFLKTLLFENVVNSTTTLTL